METVAEYFYQYNALFTVRVKWMRSRVLHDTLDGYCGTPFVVMVLRAALLLI